MNTDFLTASTIFALLATLIVMLIMPDKCRAFDCVHGDYRPIQLDDRMKTNPLSDGALSIRGYKPCDLSNCFNTKCISSPDGHFYYKWGCSHGNATACANWAKKNVSNIYGNEIEWECTCNFGALDESADMFPKELVLNIGFHVEMPTDVGVRPNCAVAAPLILAILLIALLFYHHH